MSDFYILEFHSGPNDGQRWPYPVDEARPLPALFHLGPDQYYLKANAGEKFCHYLFSPKQPLQSRAEQLE